MFERNENHSVSRAATRRPFQFGVAELLLATLVVGCVLALFVAVPAVIAAPILIFLAFALPALLTAGVVYGRGSLRAFCIGALFPSGMLMYANGVLLGLRMRYPPGIDWESLPRWVDFLEEVSAAQRLLSGMSLVLGIGVGVMCVIARRVLVGATRN